MTDQDLKEQLTKAFDGAFQEIRKGAEKHFGKDNPFSHIAAVGAMTALTLDGADFDREHMLLMARDMLKDLDKPGDPEKTLMILSITISKMENEEHKARFVAAICTACSERLNALNDARKANQEARR